MPTDASGRVLPPAHGREPRLPALGEFASLWTLDPEVTFLNHGSFGACPAAVLRAQGEWRARLERQPILFLGREVEGLLDEARAVLARFLGAAAEDIGFVPNATAGVNTVLRSLTFREGDELLVTDHEYNACRNALDFVASRAGAKVVVAPIPFPLKSARQVEEAVLSRVGERTRLLLIDHVTSPTGLVLPVAPIVRDLERRGIRCLIDGAHAPGMLPLDLGELGASYYTGNCHKWLCAPKGAGFLHVRRGLQPEIRPLAISHGANSTRRDRSLFLLEFGWTGTFDPTPFLGVAESIRQLGSLLPGGWPELMRRNRALALEGRGLLCRTLAVPSPSPEEMIGSLASVPLPEGDAAAVLPPLFIDPLQDALLDRYRIEVPITLWPAPPHRFVRISAQLYNHVEQYEYLAEALQTLLEESRRG